MHLQDERLGYSRMRNRVVMFNVAEFPGRHHLDVRSSLKAD